MTQRGSALRVVYITYRIMSVGEWYETIKIIIKPNSDLFDTITTVILYFSVVVAIFDTWSVPYFDQDKITAEHQT